MMETDIYYNSNDSQAGTPIENPDIPADTNDGNDLDKLDFSSRFASPNGASATFSGTEGANIFEFEALLNAKPEIGCQAR
jgi:hypothetical protein